MNHFIFVDYENVKITDLNPLVGHPCQVTLLLGAQQKSVPTSLFVSAAKLPGQVSHVEVGSSGRNALDMTLAYYLGRAIERELRGQYHVISKDKDYDPLIAHLHAQGYSVTRHESLATLPFLKAVRKAPSHPVPKAAPAPRVRKAPAPAPIPAPVPSRFDKLVASLGNPANKTRPTTQKRLQAYVKNELGKDATDAQVADVTGQLQTLGTLSIDAAGKVLYHK